MLKSYSAPSPSLDTFGRTHFSQNSTKQKRAKIIPAGYPTFAAASIAAAPLKASPDTIFEIAGPKPSGATSMYVLETADMNVAGIAAGQKLRRVLRRNTAAAQSAIIASV